jgi:poly(A) polymerase
LIKLPEETHTIQAKINAGQECYLVGGAVRDIVLSRVINDHDIACSFDPKTLARSVADEINGDFFVLDYSRHTYRVIKSHPGKPRIIFDFTQFQGDTLLADLTGRDFTINAMAIDLVNPGKLIDPLNGQKDIDLRILRVCSPDSFKSDPVRVIRAIRYAVSLQLQIELDTKKLLCQSVEDLTKVSAERKRDELFKIFGHSNTEKAISMLWKFGIFEILGFEFPIEMERSLQQVSAFETMIEFLTNQKGEFLVKNPEFSYLNSSLGEFKSELDAYFCGPISPDRRRLALDKLLLCFWENQANIQKISSSLALSNDEREHIQRTLQNKKAFAEINQKPRIESLDVYSYYQKLSNSGLDLLLFDFTEILTKADSPTQREEVNSMLIGIHELIRHWYREPEIVNPTPIINGEEIKKVIGEPSGPKIGLLLERLKEEQVKGKVKTKLEAFEFIQKIST